MTVASKFDTDKLNKIAELLKGIAHPLRIAIIELLTQSEELSVTEIYSSLEIDQPEASRQLNILKQLGAVKCRKEANSRYYSLAKKEIVQLIECMDSCSY